MKLSEKIKKEIREFADPGKAKLLQGFFKTGKGEYGEGDRFLGVKVPESRGVAGKYFSEVGLSDIGELIGSSFHEDRLTGLIMLVKKFERAGEKEKKKIFDFYLAHSGRVNNWDLVDLTAPNIVGKWLVGRDRKIIYKLVRSENIWERRIAMVSTLSFIKEKDLGDVFRIAEMLLGDGEDLMHKAAGWMLREAGKKDEKSLVAFLEKNKRVMPRTMLRYAIERFDEKRRKEFLLSSKV